MPEVKGASALTDETGVSKITVPKIVKDFIADALISAGAALAAANITDIGSAVQGPQVAGFAVAGAIIHAAYRIILRWATTE